eukprot:3517968-Rhodomonas_salina.4
MAQKPQMGRKGVASLASTHQHPTTAPLHRGSQAWIRDGRPRQGRLLGALLRARARHGAHGHAVLQQELWPVRACGPAHARAQRLSRVLDSRHEKRRLLFVSVPASSLWMSCCCSSRTVCSTDAH